MARTQSTYYPNDTIYRAVVDYYKDDGETIAHTANFGPYATAGTAKGVAGGQTSWSRRNGRRIEIKIQKATTVWEDV